MVGARSMVVGILQMALEVPEAFSLKDKRRIIRSLVERVRKRFNVSVAEIGQLDVWNRASLGVAIIANNRRFVNESLQKVEDFIENETSVLVIDRDMEIF